MNNNCCTPNNNTVLGCGALANYTGKYETAVGFKALNLDNVNSGNISNYNSAFGYGALMSNTTGQHNVAMGYASMINNIDGIYNTCVGNSTLYNNTNGSINTAVGFGALANNTIANYNTAIGAGALLSNTTGSNNTSVGSNTLINNTTGSNNTSVGSFALTSNTTGSYNTSIGFEALVSNNSGSSNVAIGPASLSNIVTGSNNTTIGYNTSPNNDISNIILIGYGAGLGNNTGNGDIIIGANLTPSSAGNNRCFIQNIYSSTVTGSQVYVSNNNQLGLLTSSRQFKENIQSILNDAELTQRLMALEPVAFNYRDDPQKQKQYGLIAEDVLKIMPELVGFKQDHEEVEETDKNGNKYIKYVPKGDPKPHIVHYHLLTPLLLKEVIRLDQENKLMAQEIGRLSHENEQLVQENKKLLNMMNNIVSKLEKIGITI
jgi:hypothetical protein